MATDQSTGVAEGPIFRDDMRVTIFTSHAAARSAMFDYIERFYNRKRRHSALAYATPLAAEAAWATPARTGMRTCP